MTSEPTRRCLHTNEDGSQCKAHPRENREYCFFHDPLMKDERASASRAGGVTSTQRAQAALRLPADMFTVPLDTAADLAALLRTTMEKTCRGEIDLRSGMNVAYMASILMQSMDRAERDASPTLTHDPALAPNDDERDAGPDDEESVLKLLQRGMAEAQALEEEMEAQRKERS